MSNTKYHSIGLKVKEKQESNPGRQSDDRMGENSRREGKEYIPTPRATFTSAVFRTKMSPSAFYAHFAHSPAFCAAV